MTMQPKHENNTKLLRMQTVEERRGGNQDIFGIRRQICDKKINAIDQDRKLTYDKIFKIENK